MKELMYKVILWGLLLTMTVGLTACSQDGNDQTQSTGAPVVTAKLFYVEENGGATIVGVEYGGFSSDVSKWQYEKNKTVLSADVPMANGNELTLPAQVNGLAVKKIDNPGFQKCTTIDGVVFPEELSWLLPSTEVFIDTKEDFYVTVPMGSEIFYETKRSSSIWKYGMNVQLKGYAPPFADKAELAGTWAREDQGWDGIGWAWEEFEFSADGQLAGRPYEVYGNGIKYTYSDGREVYLRMKIEDGKLLLVEDTWNTKYIASYAKVN